MTRTRNVCRIGTISHDKVVVMSNNLIPTCPQAPHCFLEMCIHHRPPPSEKTIVSRYARTTQIVLPYHDLPNTQVGTSPRSHQDSDAEGTRRLRSASKEDNSRSALSLGITIARVSR